MSRKEPRNAHATGEKVFWAPKTSLPSAGRFFGSGNVPAAGGKVFWLSKTSLPLAGTFPDPFCRESAARHPKNGEVWYNAARMVKGKQI